MIASCLVDSNNPVVLEVVSCGDNTITFEFEGPQQHSGTGGCGREHPPDTKGRLWSQPRPAFRLVSPKNPEFRRFSGNSVKF
jgi:hypothetical protein